MSKQVIKLGEGERVGAGDITPGTIIDYGDGSMGIAVPYGHTPEKDYLDNISSGFAASSALSGGVNMSDLMSGNQEAYESFYKDPNLGRYAARAATITNTNPFNLDFFADQINLAKNYEDDPYEAMRLAERYFRLDPIAGRIIELMAQFSIAGMRNQLGNDDIKQFYDAWGYQIGLTQILNRIFLHYYLHGNVFVLKTLVNFKPGEIDPNFKFRVDEDLGGSANMSKASRREIEQLTKEFDSYYNKYMNNEISAVEMAEVRDKCANAARKHVWSKSMIPGNYTVLDPKQIRLHGPGDFGLGVMTYRVSETLKKMIQDPTDVGAGGVTINSKHVDYQKKLILSIPKDILSQIQAGENEVILDPNFVSSIHRMKMDFEPLAFPLMTRAMKALHMKNRMREMDNAVINNMISQMVVVKVGSDKFPAKPGQMEALAQAYQQAVQSKNLMLFWNHTIEVERVPVDVEILSADKYEVWNNDIRDAFGVSPLLLGRNEGSSGSAFMSVKGFLENLQQGREDVLGQFMYPEYHGIASAQNFPGYPEVVFDKFKLEDESSMINTLVKLVQSGIIDYETAVEELGFDWRQVLKRHRQQAPLKDSGIIRLASPNNTTGTNSVEGGRPGDDGEPGGQPNSRPKSDDANPEKKVVEDEDS